MSDFQTAAFTGAQHAQQAMSVHAGEFWARGTALVLVTEVHLREYQVAWIDETGAERLENINDFFERALTPLGEVKVRESAYLTGAWETASARNIPRDIRALALSRVLRRAPDGASHLTVLRWSRSLSLGLEPTRRAT